jgi:hypothetical protein
MIKKSENRVKQSTDPAAFVVELGLPTAKANRSDASANYTMSRSPA